MGDDVRDHWWWRPGWRVGQRGYAWHLTFAGRPGLHRLVRHRQAALAHLPQLDPVPRAGLHLTLQDVGFAADVPPPVLARVTGAVRARLAAVPPFDLVFERVEVFPESVVLMPEPAEPVRALRAAIRAGLADVLGAVPEPAHAFVPHLAVAYVNSPGPAAPIRAALHAAPRRRTTVPIRAATLAEQHRDAGVYELRTVGEAGLGSARD